MPDYSNLETNSIDEKSVDFFVERLAEILLMQVEQEGLVYIGTKNLVSRGGHANPLK